MKRRIFPIIIFSLVILVFVFTIILIGTKDKNKKGGDDNNNFISGDSYVSADDNGNTTSGEGDVIPDKEKEEALANKEEASAYYETDNEKLITKYGFLALMQKKFGLQPSKEGKSLFPDVADGSTYADVVVAATEGGLIDADGKPFNGNEYITGREAALILMRYIGPIKVMSATGKTEITDDIYIEASVDYDVIAKRRLDERITVEQATDIIDNGAYFMSSQEALKTVADIKIKNTTKQIDISQIKGVAKDYSVLNLYHENAKIKAGDYISFQGIDGSIMGKKVTYVDGTLIGLESCPAGEVFDSYKVQCVVPAKLVGFDDSYSVAEPVNTANSDQYFASPCSIQDSVKVSNGFKFSFAYNSATKEQESLANGISCSTENLSTGQKGSFYVEANIFDTLSFGMDITITDIYCVIEADLISIHPFLAYTLKYDAIVGGSISVENAEDDFYYPYVSFDAIPDSLKEYVTVEAGLCFSYELSGKFGIDTYWKDCVTGFKYYLIGGTPWPILEANLTDFDWYATGKASVYPIKLNAKVSVCDVVAYAGIGVGVSVEANYTSHYEVNADDVSRTGCFDIVASYPDFKFVAYMEFDDFMGTRKGGLSFEEHYAPWQEGFHIENWKIVDKCSYGNELNLLKKTEAGKRTEAVIQGEVKIVEPSLRAVYADYLQNIIDNSPEGVEYAMSLEDINGDYIPELLYAEIDSGLEDKVHVLTYIEGHGVVEMGETGVYGSVRFSPGRSIFAYDMTDDTRQDTFIQRLDGNSKIVERMLRSSFFVGETPETSGGNPFDVEHEEYYMDGVLVSNSEFEKFISELEKEGILDNSYCLWSWDLAYPATYLNLVRFRNSIELERRRDESLLSEDEYLARKAYRKYIEELLAASWNADYGDYNYTTVTFNFYDFDNDGITELYYLYQPLYEINPVAHIARYDADTNKVVEISNGIADESSAGFIQILPDSNSFRVVNTYLVGEPDVLVGESVEYYKVENGILTEVATVYENAKDRKLTYKSGDVEITREQFLNLVRELGYTLSENEIFALIDADFTEKSPSALKRFGAANISSPNILDMYVTGLLELTFDSSNGHYVD